MQITVDHAQLVKTAETIETYVGKHKSNMSKINQTVMDLGTTWQGEDYNQVKSEWQEINAADSTSGMMVKSLENYADYLRYAAGKYKDVQSNAVNRANGLPNY